MDSNANIEDLKEQEHTDLVFKALCELHPELSWEIVDKESTAYVDDDVANRLIGLVFDEITVFDLFSSECGRFQVSPDEAYAVPSSTAQILSAHNKISN